MREASRNHAWSVESCGCGSMIHSQFHTEPYLDLDTVLDADYGTQNPHVFAELIYASMRIHSDHRFAIGIA